MKKTLILAAAVVAIAQLAACGVRGRPQPPIEPTQLGRGKPSFTRANQEFAVPDVPSPEASPTPINDDGESY